MSKSFRLKVTEYSTQTERMSAYLERRAVRKHRRVTGLCPDCRKRRPVDFDQSTGWWLACWSKGCQASYDIPEQEAKEAGLL